MSKELRILQVVPANIIGNKLSCSPFITNEIQNLKLAGLEVETYYFTSRLNLKDFRRAVLDVKNKIRAFKPDVVHAQFGSITSYLILRACGSRIPYVITFGGNDLLGHPNKGFYWRVREWLAVKLSRLSANKASGIITVSKNLFDALGKSDQSKTSIIPRGINTDFFKPMDKLECRKKLGWELDEVVVLFNQSQKNAQVKNYPLAESAFKLYKNNANHHVRMEVLIDRTPDEVVCILNASDVIIVTSLHEGSPNIVKESLACNLPVVTVPCGDVRERLNGVSPSYICDYDASDLSNKLNRVLSSGVRSNGREVLFSQGVDNAHSVEKIKEVYINAKEIFSLN